VRLACLLLTAVVGAWGAPLKVGEFAQEVRQVFTAAASGLPSDDVRCVAAAGDRVWAGTARGLAVRSAGGAWSLVGGSDAVDACAASGADVVWVAGGRVMRGSTVAGQVSGGKVHAVAAVGNRVAVGTESGLFFGPTLTRVMDGPVYAVALRESGEAAAGGAAGLFVLRGREWVREFPRDGGRSWAPVDVRGVGFDSKGRLWFFSPQGAGVREGSTWRLFTGAEGLPYDDATGLAVGPAGAVWLATKRGAIRYDGQQWSYRQGLRWLPDDAVRGVAVDGSGGAWFATSKGVGLIERKPTRLADKARFYEDEIDKRHRRTEYEYVMTVRLTKPGDKSNWVQTDSDNDGLWTSMYGAGECFAFGATKDPVAKRRAVKAFEALRFLSVVTQGGSHPAPAGFPARAILPTSGPDPNIGDSRARDVRMQASRDSLWKIMSPRWPKSADGKWYWKTDTSSDELDGHYFFYAVYYDLVAETEREKEEVRAVVRAITDHIITHNWALVDWDGKPTRWAVFDPVSLNDDRMWWNGRGLNSLSILSYLKVAEHMTGDPRYREAYDKLVREHKYATNTLVAKVSTGAGSGNQSDDEMALMSYYNLLKYETDDDLRQKYAGSLANYWAIERLEKNPFFNFIGAASLTGKKFTDAYGTNDLTPKGAWLEQSVDTLRRMPLDRIDWAHTNSHRKDIERVRLHIWEDSDRPPSGHLHDGTVIPVDERYFGFWNHNPYTLDTRGSGNSLGDGGVFLLPYYMGLYHKFIED